ncbi:MAG: hypothetical protein N3A54_01910 [Patescibacteria group bacterium]|nr:hypothetical protein [Patescibacteria group bacterium]
MKIQDVCFFVLLISLLFLKKPKLFLIGGIFCYILAIPLFQGWIFFTAERLTWYGSLLILLFLLVFNRYSHEVE